MAVAILATVTAVFECVRMQVVIASNQADFSFVKGGGRRCR